MDDLWIIIKCWAEAGWAYVKAYASVFTWFLLLPTSSLVLVLVVLGVFGAIDEDSAFALTKKMLPWSIGLSGFMAGLVVSMKDRYALSELIRPRVSMDLDCINAVGDLTKATIKLKGLAAQEARIEVYCLDAQPTATGNNKVILRPPFGDSLTLHWEEPEFIEVLAHNAQNATDIHVAIPCKSRSSPVTGEEFILTIAAFGQKMKKVELKLRCGVRNNRMYVENI